LSGDQPVGQPMVVCVASEARSSAKGCAKPRQAVLRSERRKNRCGPRPEDRASHLECLRRLKMTRDSHAFVRGSTVQFYQWLGEAANRIPQGPPIWICGDCHLGNLGPLADEDGHVAVQLRDFDQTVIGNPAHDIIRLSFSLACAARQSDRRGANRDAQAASAEGQNPTLTTVLKGAAVLIETVGLFNAISTIT